MGNSQIYTPSVNIIRDIDKALSYIPTDNGDRITAQFENEFSNGQRSFMLIGSYGTGKSAFLWAYTQSLIAKKKERYYDAVLTAGLKADGFEVMRYVGEYCSLLDTIAEELEVYKTKDKVKHVLQAIYNKYRSIEAKNKLLLIIVDEFGKHLEYAAQHNPEQELYFIQQLSEFCNNAERNICLITSVHQNFDAYADGLDQRQRNEWSKVKGRFKEITFNEPVEQLLFLASEHLLAKQMQIPLASIKLARAIANKTKVLHFSPGFIEEIADKLAPLDLLAAHSITVGLQRYGQNERSLFSFLESVDHTSVGRFKYNEASPFYSIAQVYDYLVFNFYSFLYSRHNSDYLAWASIRSSLESLERFNIPDSSDLEKLVKTIGLINLFAPKGAILDKVLLGRYGEVCLGIQSPDEKIDFLQRNKIVLYREYASRYILTEGTDLDIQLALKEATSKVDAVTDIPTQIKTYFDLTPVLAKRYSFENGTPSVFAYRLTADPVAENPKGDIDGFINLIFNEKLSLDEVTQLTSNDQRAILYGYYKNASRIKEQLFDIARTQRVIQEHTDDRVAQRELTQVLEHQKNLLNHYILDGQFNGDVVWIFKGSKVSDTIGQIDSPKGLNNALSVLAGKAFYSAPRFSNELINRHRISPSVQIARRNYLGRLIDQWHKPDLGFDPNEFPPEKAIYLTLVQSLGLRLEGDTPYDPANAHNPSFTNLWETCSNFLKKSQYNRLPISELTEELEQPPFKLKQGFIDFWIPTFFFIKRNDYALFHDGSYVPNLSADILELMTRYPRRFDIKAFDVAGLRLELFNSYRQLINISTTSNFSNAAFIETVRPFLSFYQNLPQYTKLTSRLSKETIKLRVAISKAKDPEKTFFEDFPLALGYSTDSLIDSQTSLRTYTDALENSIRELRGAFDNLATRFEEYMINLLRINPNEDVQKALQGRLEAVRSHLLTPYQRTFVQRANSKLDERKTYLSSLAQAIVGKTLENITDEDELILHDKLNRLLTELDALSDLSKVTIDPEMEQLVSLEIGSLSKGILKTQLRLPTSNMAGVTTQVDKLRGNLSLDSSVDIAALTTLLQELLSK